MFLNSSQAISDEKVRNASGSERERIEHVHGPRYAEIPHQEWRCRRVEKPARVTGGVLGSHYQDIFAFLVLVLVLVLKPSGLLGKNTVERA